MGAAGIFDLGGCSEPAAERPAPDVGPAVLPVCYQQATGEQGATGRRLLLPPKGGATYVAVTATGVAAAISVLEPPTGPLKPTAKSSESSALAIAHEMTHRRNSPDMSGPLSGMPDGTTRNAHVANERAGGRANKTPVFNTGVILVPAPAS